MPKIKNPVTISKIKYCQYLLSQLLKIEHSHLRLGIMNEMADTLKEIAKVV